MHDTEIGHEDEGAETHLPVIQSRLLGPRFRHGFTTRLGGVSEPPFGTLNLGARWGDASAAVAENLRRLRGAGTEGAEIHFATQVHGAEVAQVEARQSPRATGGQRADGLVTVEPGVAVGVLAADCVPILVGDVGTGGCAAVHAGWRGTVSGVLQATLRRLLDLPGADVANLRVAIGPSIGPCCFEVGPEVIEQVERAFGEAHREGDIVQHPRRPKAHVDLWCLNRLAARGLGVAAAHVEVAERCTFCDAERFFSYRRDQGRTGQQGAFIRCPPLSSRSV